jgi:hypothetical protein
MHEDLVNFSSLKTISFAKPSTQTNLVNRIFETSNEFNRQRLIVTFIKPNTNIPLSNSEGEMKEAELDSQERQQNVCIVNINPLPLLPFQKARSTPNSLIKKNYKFIVVSKLSAPSTTFGANSVKLIETRMSQQNTMLFFNGGSSRLIVKYIISLGSEGSHTACRLLLNCMPQLKMYEQYTYQCSHQYLRHILKEQELNQDIKKILTECKQLKAIPAR